jgi:hypothetical protein
MVPYLNPKGWGMKLLLAAAMALIFGTAFTVTREMLRVEEMVVPASKEVGACLKVSIITTEQHEGGLTMLIEGRGIDPGELRQLPKYPMALMCSRFWVPDTDTTGMQDASSEE